MTLDLSPESEACTDAVEVEWDRATQAEARDFARWMAIAPKPVRVHWRGHPASPKVRPTAGSSAGVPNVTGQAGPGLMYAVATRARCETVLRSFCDFHLDAGTGPIVNPFPLGRERRRLPSAAGKTRSSPGGRYRPSVPVRIPGRIPDTRFDELFAKLRHNRDRALLEFWVSNGARAEELLTCRQRDVLPGEQLLGVVRKGTRAYQQVPSAADRAAEGLLPLGGAARAAQRARVVPPASGRRGPDPEGDLAGRAQWQDPKGKEIAAAPAPLMWDASEDPKTREPENSDRV
ncbi:hypothetical protein SUDANB1_00022 [Streptomyces sp. enrichment culture]|uniref:hypothetical protein n=1 Tax=Streptomyces sp. enrichment culture TaxID=1795815 RepID=UPI003F5788DF